MTYDPFIYVVGAVTVSFVLWKVAEAIQRRIIRKELKGELAVLEERNNVIKAELLGNDVTPAREEMRAEFAGNQGKITELKEELKKWEKR